MFRSILRLLALAALGFCANLGQVNNFGDNPTLIDMYIYVPDQLAASPPVIVAVSKFLIMIEKAY